MPQPIVDDKIKALIPPLPEHERAALETSLIAEGCLDSLKVWQSENILLDGHHRLAICEAQDPRIEYATTEIVLADRNAAELWVLRNTLARRNLSPYQRAEIALEIEKREKPAAQARMEAGKKDPRKTFAQGKARDLAAAQVGLSGPTLDKARLIHEKADDKTKQRLRRAETTISKVHGKLVRSERKKKQARKAKGDKRIGKANLLLGDIQKRGLKIKDGSITLIFTDPPYEQKALPLWSDLSAFAARTLKPNGLLIAYTGALYLPDVIRHLEEHLDYWWCGAIYLPGTHSRVHARHLSQGSKPLLFFVRDAKTFKPRAWIEDTWREDETAVVSESRQKAQHPWQQSIGCAKHFIESLTRPGDLVADPFLGGGTTAVAALQAGRDFVGIEPDRAAFVEAEERIAQEQSGGR